MYGFDLENKFDSNLILILKDWGAMLLRYFNPVGAHPSGVNFTNVLHAAFKLVGPKCNK